MSVVFSCVAFAAQKAPEKVDLTGTWTSEKCESMPNGQGGETYFTRTFPMTNKEWKIDFTVFGDKDCTQALFTLDVAGDWELRGKSKAVKGAHNAFFGFKTRTLTAKADGAVQFMNQAGFCGKKDWKVGEAVDINSTGCAQIGAKPITDCNKRVRSSWAIVVATCARSATIRRSFILLRSLRSPKSETCGIDGSLLCCLPGKIRPPLLEK